MEAILYISVSAIAIAFVILVIYIISTLKTISKTLERASNTVDDLEGQIKGVSKEAEALLKKTNILADDLQKKSEKIDSVIDAATGIGQTIQQFNTSLAQVGENVTNRVNQNQEKISQVVSWAQIALEIKEKWDEMRTRKQQKQAQRQENVEG
ncbi:DUF948 domain-containing protein [Pallidibacillus pasinlerensis]|uniref:DUF948 domain-containing protein n=1 Tax=Pallidibacillus pasinlerensis TaxID=2703818 RepID=A0ABX0A9V2_9BACI|nr:DUF948 domain-containing protein [Pallidibacillus pasinlerensis]NCU18990.1 DUF948 domain-containing protein [Pallidibacillus pasinlerensis]